MRKRHLGMLAGIGTCLALVWFAAAQSQRPPAASGQNAGHGDELGFTDTPMLPGLPYHVHDPARPHPAAVTPAAEPFGAPSDATVLFDGHDLSQWKFERRQMGAGGRSMSAEALAKMQKSQTPLPPLGWKLEDGYVEVVPRAGDMLTKEKFGDVQLHVNLKCLRTSKGTARTGATAVC
jgi:hypothetical protein